jgi:hypothetical protein
LPLLNSSTTAAAVPSVKLDIDGMVARADNLDDVIMDSLAKQGSTGQIGMMPNKERKLTSRMINSASKSIADLFEALII